MAEFEGVHGKEIDHEAVMRITNYWDARYADIQGVRYEGTGIEFGAFGDIASQIGFSETRRVINFYLLEAEEPSLEDFLANWKGYQLLAQGIKHDRMYRHPDIRQENVSEE